MIYVTGDTHGDFDRIAHFCARMNTKPSDIMIILGDAGINFFGGWRDALLIHLRQTDNECLKCSGGISIPQRLELIGGHAGHFSEVLTGFTARGSGNPHFDQSLRESRTAHFGFDADRGQRRSKAQNLRFGQTYLCTGSGQTHILEFCQIV